MYLIKTEHFEGPLDLLLQLIEKNELDITRLSLAAVADQYVEYVESSENISIEHMADFLGVAARLLLLKSRALLPTLDIEEEGEEDVEDLEEQLKLYKRFKEVSMEMGKALDGGNKMFGRAGFIGVDRSFVFDISHLKVTAVDLRSVFAKVLAAIPDPEKLKEKIIRRTISLEEKVGQLKAFIAAKTKFLFSEVAGAREDRVNTVVSFLAILELVKKREVEARQEGSFEEIEIHRRIS